jgi:hypothetical protein
MDFVRAYTTIKNQDLIDFKRQINKDNVINKILSRFRMNTFFVLASRTKPYILINFNNLKGEQGEKCFNIIFEESQKYYDRDGTLNWYMPFYMTSSPKAFNDQRMFYYMQNADRMQTILDYPPISSNTLNYLTQVAYYTQAFDGQKYAIYRCGQYIVTPVNEVSQVRQLDFFLSNLSAITASNQDNSVVVFQPNQSTNYITSPSGFISFNNNRNMYRIGVYKFDSTIYSPNGVSVSLYFVTTPQGNFVQPAYQPYTDPLTNQPVDNTKYVWGTTESTDPLGAVITYLENPSFLRQQDFFSSNPAPFLYQGVFASGTGGSQSPYTMSSVSCVETDLIAYLGAAGAEGFWNGNDLRYWPKLTPIAICDQSIVPVILGYNSTFGRLQLPQDTITPYWLDKNLYSNVYDDLDFFQVWSSYAESTATIRTGYNQICTDLDINYLSNYSRIEIYPFNLTKNSPFVKLRFTGVSSSLKSNFTPNTEIFKIGNNSGPSVVTDLGATSTFLQFNTEFTPLFFGTSFTDINAPFELTIADNLPGQASAYRQTSGNNIPLSKYFVDPTPNFISNKVFRFKKLTIGNFVNEALPQNFPGDTPITEIADTATSRYMGKVIRMSLQPPDDILTDIFCWYGENLAMSPKLFSTAISLDVLSPQVYFRFNNAWNFIGTIQQYVNLFTLYQRLGSLVNFATEGQGNPRFDILVVWQLPINIRTNEELIAYMGFTEPYKSYGVPSMPWYDYNNTNQNNQRMVNCASSWPFLAVVRADFLDNNFTFSLIYNINAGPAISKSSCAFLVGTVTDNSGVPCSLLTTRGNTWGFSSFNTNQNFGNTIAFSGTRELAFIMSTYAWQAINAAYWPTDNNPQNYARIAALTTFSIRYVLPLASNFTFTPSINLNKFTAQGEAFNNYGGKSVHSPNRNYGVNIAGKRCVQFWKATKFLNAPISTNIDAPGSVVIHQVFEKGRIQYYGEMITAPPDTVSYKNFPNRVLTDYRNCCEVYNPFYSDNATETLYYVNAVMPDLSGDANLCTYFNPVIRASFPDPTMGLTGAYNLITEGPITPPVRQAGFLCTNANPEYAILDFTTKSDTALNPLDMMNYLRQFKVLDQIVVRQTSATAPNTNSLLNLYIYTYNNNLPGTTLVFNKSFYSTAINQDITLTIDRFDNAIPANHNCAFIRIECEKSYEKNLVAGLGATPDWVWNISWISQPTPTSIYAGIRPASIPNFNQTFRYNFGASKDISFKINADSEIVGGATLFFSIVDLNDSKIEQGVTVYKQVFASDTMWDTNQDYFFASIIDYGLANGALLIQVEFDQPSTVIITTGSVPSQVVVDPTKTIFDVEAKPLYIALPLTQAEFDYYGQIYLLNPYTTAFWIELDLLLFGGNRDYIWNQFNQFTAIAKKENDQCNISNMMVLTDNAENYGYLNAYTMLYNQYDAKERFYWQKWLKKSNALFLTSFNPQKLRDYPVWDINLVRYLTLFFR